MDRAGALDILMGLSVLNIALLPIFGGFKTLFAHTKELKNLDEELEAPILVGDLQMYISLFQDLLEDC